MPIIESLQPTQQFILFGGAVEILCFGRETGDWSLRDETELLPGYPRTEVLEAVGRLADAYGCRIYAPRTSDFNAQVIDARQLADELVEGKLYRGVAADGVVLGESGQAFALSSADCPTFVLWDSITSTVIAAHAGRDSLIDRREAAGAARPWEPRRKSVVEAAISSMPLPSRRGGNARFKAFVACGIGPLRFGHRMQTPLGSNEGNNALVKWVRLNYGDICLTGDPTDGRINLNHIIRTQCVRLGLRPEDIGYDGVDTYRDRYPDGRHIWHSHRREGDGTRNLVLVIRRS